MTASEVLRASQYKETIRSKKHATLGQHTENTVG
jgi:hypothetical protein